MKFHLLGGPGSGKTTLARQLARRFRLLHVDLDRLGQRFGPRPQPYLDATRALALQDDWVSDGIYGVAAVRVGRTGDR